MKTRKSLVKILGQFGYKKQNQRWFKNINVNVDNCVERCSYFPSRFIYKKFGLNNGLYSREKVFKFYVPDDKSIVFL